MVFLNETIYLTDDVIARCSEKSGEIYKKQAGKRAASETKVKLAVEELLIQCKECYGENAECQLIGKRSLSHQLTLELRHIGQQKDPTAQEEGMQFSYDILSRLGIKPRYSYSARYRKNSIQLGFELKPAKNKMLYTILVAIALAVILNIGLKAVAPNVLDYIFINLAKPIFDKLTAIIAAMATPLVFFSVITGITGLGDAAAFGNIGKKVCLAMGLTYGIAGLVTLVSSLFVYPVAATSAAESQSVLGQVVELVLDIIPDNLIQPFAIDNDLQVITIAIFIGAVMLIIGNQLKTFSIVVTEASNLINKMMTIACKSLPAIVFLGIFNLLYSSNIEDFISIYRMALLFVALSALVIVITIIRTCKVTRVPYRILFNKVLPTLMINLTTSSQVSALPENLHCCKDKFGIDPKIVDFAIPLGIVVYMPCGAIFLSLTLISLASISGTALTLAALIKGIVVCIILAIAAPPIPGSAFAVMPIMFAACGIPQDVYPLAIVLGTILGYFLPAFNGFLLQHEILMVAHKMDKVDKDVLAAPYEE